MGGRWGGNLGVYLNQQYTRKVLQIVVLLGKVRLESLDAHNKKQMKKTSFAEQNNINIINFGDKAKLQNYGICNMFPFILYKFQFLTNT